MKQFVVFIGMVVLGITIHGIIMGPQDDSVFSVTKNIWKNQIEINKNYP